MKPPQIRTYPASLDCRYLMQVPERRRDSSLLVVALHGYGMNAEIMLRLTTQLVGEDHLIASLQAPHPFYLSQQLDAGVGYNWGTRSEWQSSIRLHHDMLQRVLEETGRNFGASPRRTLLMGFSQPVGLNYRFAATFPALVSGVIGICGGVPRDWEEAGYQSVAAALLHIARLEDEYYPPEVARQIPERLRKYARDVEFHLIPGQHRFPSRGAAIAGPWMERVFNAAL